MKRMKRILFIILALTLAFSLFACGGGGDDDPCKTHVDKNEDSKCDKCGETMKEEGTQGSDVILVENGEIKFQIVYATDLSSTAMGKVNAMKTKFLGAGLNVERVVEKNDNVKDCEILIGNITTRGDKYKTDGHDYGMEGYVIKIVDSKIIINAGSDEMLGDAIDEFLEDIIKIDEKNKDFTNITMSKSQQVEVIQDDYKITSLTVDGKDMKGYTIAVDTSNTYHMEAATALQEAVYERAGYWFNIVSIDKASDTSVIIKSVNKTEVDGGFKISTNSKKQLVIECGFDNKIKDAFDDFIADKIVAAKAAIDFKGTVHTDDISVVYYKEFGAKGDGKVDDFFALKAAHDFANISGQTVKADSGKIYYIHETRVNGTGTPQTISIQTNVIWTGAKFIIDDTDISTFDGTGRASASIFAIKQSTATKTIRDKTILQSVLSAGLNQQTTKIDLGLGEAAMIIPYNSSHKVYRHRGYSEYLGGDMQEIVVIDANGNIDPETPLMFDYTNLNKIDVYSLSDQAITIEGGEFTTRASHIDITYKEGNSTKYHEGNISRGFSISRSNLTLKNVKHYVTGEISLKEQKSGMIGPAYNGFFTMSNATHITLDGCVVTGRRCYSKPNGGGTSGTYALSANRVNKLVLKNCTQSNFWVVVDDDGNIQPATENTPGVQLSMGTAEITGKKMHWGSGGTNYCKNMEYIDSTISRFDAHCGLYNGKIINSTVNYMAITGAGEMLIENSRWFAEEDNYNANSLIHLREDFGSTWDGTVKIDGLKAYVFTRGTKEDGYNGTKTWLIMHVYTNWYYGYQTCFPSLEINDLDYYDIKTRQPLPADFEIKLCNTSVTDEPALHLNKTTNTYAIYSYEDNDKDGYVDGTTVVYDKNNIKKGGVYGDVKDNLNPVKPPEFIKITNNDGVNGAGGYIYVIPKTSGKNVSDGGYYNETESNGGFFGDTEFITEENTYLGTNHQNTVTFKFQ